MTSVTLHGDINLEEVELFIAKHFPTRNIKVSSSVVEDSNLSKHESDAAEIEKLKKWLVLREQDQKDMEESLLSSAQAIQKLHQQQRALFDEFSLLRTKYDGLKVSVIEALWEHCSRYHPILDQIPPMETDINDFEESPEKIGRYTISSLIGEGQFATVWTCTKDDSTVELAMKRIIKDRMTTFSELKNISNEINILRGLDSKYIIELVDTIHTKSKLYIITEKGGADLFEFFDNYGDGVPEEWVKDIMGHIISGVTYCHLHGVCHRDLKPENILMDFDVHAGKVENLKICDFGLAAKFSESTVLLDFCGSPGFFAPEMILHGEYFGDKADVWSIGCIALELLLGHDVFLESWLSTYEYEVLQSKVIFEKRIHASVKAVPSLLKFSDELCELIKQFIVISPTQRSRLTKLCQDAWIQDHVSSELLQQAEAFEGAQDKLTPKTNLTALAGGIRKKDAGSRHRRRMEELKIVTAESDRGGRTAPVEPDTPNIGAAKTILQSGQKLAIQSLRESIKERRVSEVDEVYNSARSVGSAITAAIIPSNPQSARRSITETAIHDIIAQSHVQSITNNAKKEQPIIHLTPRRRSVVLTPIEGDSTKS